ncbi:MAG: NfeD family protein [Hyphomicrobium sp.]
MNSFIDLIFGNAAYGWSFIGILFLIVEVLFPMGFYLSFSIAAFLVSGALWFNLIGPNLLWNAIDFAALGLILTPISKKVLQYFDKTKDINQY